MRSQSRIGDCTDMTLEQARLIFIAVDSYIDIDAIRVQREASFCILIEVIYAQKQVGPLSPSRVAQLDSA